MTQVVTLVGGPFDGMMETVDRVALALDLYDGDVGHRYERQDSVTFIYVGVIPDPYYGESNG